MADAEEQRRAAAEAVGERPEDELRHTEADHVGGDDELPLVLVGHAQILAHVGQGGQHDVDGQRIERHEGSDEGNEFGPGQNPLAKCLICHLMSAGEEDAARCAADHAPQIPDWQG